MKHGKKNVKSDVFGLKKTLKKRQKT